MRADEQMRLPGDDVVAGLPPKTQAGSDEAVLAVDVGGTHVRVAPVLHGAIVDRFEAATPQTESQPTAIFDLMQHALAHHVVHHAVVGLPGRVNYVKGTLEYAPNLPPTWVQELNEDTFGKRLGLDVMVANDADLAAVGEASVGAGREFDDVVYITVSTGVGAGVLLGRRLVAGARSLAEIGHIVIDRIAARSDEPATVEQLGSGTALARDAKDLGILAHDAALLRVIESDDPRLGRAWRDVREGLGYAVVAMAHLFSPQVIVIGGGLGRASESLLIAARNFLDVAGPRGLPHPIKVVASRLGDDAGLLGAPAWAAPMSSRSRPRPLLDVRPGA